MQRLRSTALAATIAVVAALSLAACGDDDGPAAGGDVSAEDLDGRSFVATSIEGHTIVEGSEVVITFTEGSISVQAGCNTQNAGFEVTDGVLEVSQMASTMMACDEALMDQDTVVATLLTASPTIALDGDELTIATDDTEMSLTAVS